MSATRLLLHVGFPKTGTTTLQGTLFPRLADCAYLGKTTDKHARFSPDLPELDRFRDLISFGSEHQVRAAVGPVSERIARLMDDLPSSAALMSLEGITNPYNDTRYVLYKDNFAKARHAAMMLAPLAEAGVSVEVLATLRRQSALLPSLYSQVFFHAFPSGLIGRDYGAFLDFLFGDDLIGAGTDFDFAAYLDVWDELIGAERVHAADMAGLFTGEETDDIRRLAAFLGIPPAACLEGIGGGRLNVRAERGGTRRMMTRSPAVHRFEKRTGFDVSARAFSPRERLARAMGRPVRRHVPDETARIDAFYADANARLAETRGIAL